MPADPPDPLQGVRAVTLPQQCWEPVPLIGSGLPVCRPGATRRSTVQITATCTLSTPALTRPLDRERCCRPATSSPQLMQDPGEPGGGDGLHTCRAGTPGGAVVVVEWARERFDEATARWCFAWLPGPGGNHCWLQERHAEWRASGQPWDAYLRSWVQAERLHAGMEILSGFDARFYCEALGFGPCFFPDLAGIGEADEQAAIDAGLIPVNRIQYMGRRTGRALAPSA
jgi:hypothetical protein